MSPDEARQAAESLVDAWERANPDVDTLPTWAARDLERRIAALISGAPEGGDW